MLMLALAAAKHRHLRGFSQKYFWRSYLETTGSLRGWPGRSGCPLLGSLPCGRDSQRAIVTAGVLSLVRAFMRVILDARGEFSLWGRGAAESDEDAKCWRILWVVCFRSTIWSRLNPN